MTIDELITELQEWKSRNTEPEVPNFDPGETEVRVESEDGTYESKIVEVTDANGPWIIVEEPDYQDVSHDDYAKDIPQ